MFSRQCSSSWHDTRCVAAAGRGDVWLVSGLVVGWRVASGERRGLAGERGCEAASCESAKGRGVSVFLVGVALARAFPGPPS